MTPSREGREDGLERSGDIPLLGGRLSRAAKDRRLLDGVAEAIATTGYHDLTIAQLASGADVSLATFRHRFPDKEAAVLALLRRSRDEVLDRTAAACFLKGSPIEILEGAVSEVLRWAAEERGPSKALLVDAQAIGRPGLEVQSEVIDALAARAVASGAMPQGQSDTFPLLFVCGGVSALRERIQEGRAGSAIELLPQILWFYRQFPGTG